MSEEHTERLTGKLLTDRAPEVQRELMTALAEHPQLCLDLSAVEAIDVTGLQLLLAARISQRARGHALQFSAPSPAVRELCSALGVSLEKS